MRRLILPLLAAGMIWVMVIVMVAFWGSIGSAVMAFGLISMCCALLYQRFLNRDDPDLYE